jgi:hypothetical protein
MLKVLTLPTYRTGDGEIDGREPDRMKKMEVIAWALQVARDKMADCGVYWPAGNA